MSVSHQSGSDDEELVRYLLELLPDAATERLDEACIADDEVAGRLRIVEGDLVDDYVRGRLAGHVLERFESRYLSSPRRREKVRLAACFVRAVDRAAPPAAGEDESAGHVFAHWQPARVAALAAALLLASGALLYQAAWLPRSQTIPSAPSHAGSAGRGPSPEMPLTELVLSPQTRAVDAIPALVVPPGAMRVAFELRLGPNVFRRYQARLKNPATNEIVWRSGWLTPRSTGDRSSVSFTVPASTLSPQHYSIDLAGNGAAAAAEIVESYTFRVSSR
jgi:hypothetical protein